MTDLASALADTSQLSAFDGRDVIRTTVAVTNAGDGLSEAMSIEPREMHHGQRVYLVLECEVSKIRFDPVKDTNALTRVHVLRAGNASLVDADLVKKHLDEQAERIQRAKDAASGQGRLDDEAASLSAELLAAHEEGQHAGLPHPNCPTCQDEEPDADA